MTSLQGTRWNRQSNRIAAVAVYEDTITDARVGAFCRSVAEHLGRNREMMKQAWLLSELRVPQLRSIAAEEAADADLIIVALHHADSLPAEVTSWIDQWLERRRGAPGVLVALFDPLHQGVSSSMQAYLKQVAEKAKMEFLAESDETPMS